MKLITPDLATTVPMFFSQEKDEDPLAPAKFFCPWGAATWWAIEYCPDSHVCFGFATLGDPDMAELGYFSLEELESIKGPAGLTIERDLYYTPKRLSEIRKAVQG